MERKPAKMQKKTSFYSSTNNEWP